MATYYFLNTDGDDDWANSDNWYFDSNGTIPANSVPSSTDDAIIDSWLSTDSSSSAIINNLFISSGNTSQLSITVLGLCTIDGGYFGDGATITGDVLVTTNGYLYAEGTGTIIGDLTFANNGQSEGGFSNTDVYGNVYFLGNWTGPYAGVIKIYNNYNAIFYYGYTGSVSPTFYGTGTSYYANYPTLYFNAAIDSDWNTISNWWVDSNFSNQSYNIPNATDDVIASASITSNSGSEPTVANFALSTGSLSISITVTGNATFTNSSHNDDTITGNGEFYNDAYNNGTITGTGHFDGTGAYNVGIINSGATFSQYAYNGGTVNGNCTLNDNAQNNSSGIINGNCTFYDYSNNNTGTVNGNCTFNNNASNIGTVNGDTTFNDYSYNDGNIAGSAVFEDSSYNNTNGYLGISIVTFNDNSFNIGNPGSATITWNGLTGINSYGRFTGGQSNPSQSGTFYFFNTASSDWNNISNWYSDIAGTVAAPSLPTSIDSVITSASITSNSGSEPTVVNFTTNGGTFEINITVTGTATMANNYDYSYTITGNAIFSGAGYLYNGTINGNVTFNNGGYHSGTINGDATFNSDSKWSLGTISGHATFNDNSFNRGTLNNATFNDGSHNGASGEGAGTVNGDCTFNDYSYNFGDYTFISYVYGNCTFNDYAYNSGSVGSISTTTTFNDNSYNNTIYGVIEVATFNNFSRNYGVINVCSFYNNSANYTNGVVFGVASFYDNSENYIGASAYESQYYDYSVCNNADATNPHYFHDNSTAIDLQTNGGSNGSIDGFPFKIVSPSLDPLTFIRAGYGINNSNILGLI